MKHGLFFLLILSMAGCSASVNNPSRENTSAGTDGNTYALIVGALSWSDPSLSSFEKKNRKDEELANLLLSNGVNKNNLIFLKDEEATLENIKTGMKDLLKKTKKGSHFIFYYAGHGMQDQGKYYFANYDLQTSQPEKTGLDTEILYDLIAANFKGERISLWADCCYSGALTYTAEKLSKKGWKTYALTSATPTNTSTGNWTYTQTLIDCLKGESIMDRNNDGTITLAEMAAEIKDAMKYRERQLYGYGVFELDTLQEMSKVTKGKKRTGETGAYVFAKNNGKWEVARITGNHQGTYDCEFYYYSDKEQKSLSVSETREPYFIKHTIGKPVKVEWEGKWYEATIKKQDGDFYYITYTDFDSSYDEWVLYDRIRTGTEKKVNVFWEGKYYPADLLYTDEKRAYVHYDTYNYTWDEWTDLKNIQ